MMLKLSKALKFMAIEYFKGQGMINEFSLDKDAKYEVCPLYNLYVILDL